MGAFKYKITMKLVFHTSTALPLNRLFWVHLFFVGWMISVESLLAMPITAEPQLRLMESLYQSGDSFRAETEALRFAHYLPQHPQRPAVELFRAKLYYREGRFNESSLMLFSLLDRAPRGGVARDARQLLGLSLVQTGRILEAESYLQGAQKNHPALADMENLSRDTTTPERARTWSTWLPGSGFFVLGQPAKAWAAMSLNLFFTAATLAAWNDQLPGLALALLFTEIALYQGGRQAVWDEGQAMQQKQLLEQRREWASTQGGERPLLQVGLRFSFGG